MSRKSIIIIVSIVVLVGGGIASYFFVPPVNSWVNGIFGIAKEDAQQSPDGPKGTAPTATANLTTDKQAEVGKAIYAGDKDTVVEVYDKAISAAKTNPDKVAMTQRKAEALGQMNEVDTAIETLKDAEKIDPTDMATLSFIATLYMQKGDYKNAAVYYRRVAEIAPEQTDSGSYTKADYISRAEDAEKR